MSFGPAGPEMSKFENFPQLRTAICKFRRLDAARHAVNAYSLASTYLPQRPEGIILILCIAKLVRRTMTQPTVSRKESTMAKVFQTVLKYADKLLGLQERRAIRELSALDDRTLADIGVSRSEIVALVKRKPAPMRGQVIQFRPRQARNVRPHAA
jgi:uncharacterized protein YjiS (DUF1127 family)